MSNAPAFLIVEDDEAFSTMVASVVRGLGGKPVVCGTLGAAESAVREGGYDLLLLDNHLPDGKAYDFFGRLSRRNPEAPVVMITGAPDLGEAVSLTRNGLFDYLTKPVSVEVLEACLRRALLSRERAGRGVGEGGEMELGRAPSMREVMDQLRQASRHRSATVLLTGESGTGKDVAAQALHRMTFGEGAAGVPYVALNCAAVPAEMFESELFGAEKGAYTGAERKRGGLVGAAQGGTLFLDEIGEVPLAMQAKLLRFLEGREFRSLGSTEVQAFTGRVVAATNRDLQAEVAAGRFREDLLYRIDVFAIALPPLRERRGDIAGLVVTLLDRLFEKYSRPRLQVRPEDMPVLEAHDYPGNVRELRNILERSLLRTPEGSRWLALDRVWLSGRSQGSGVGPAPEPRIPAAGVAGGGGAEALPAERAGLSVIEAQEYRLIRDALTEARGGIRRAAGALGLSPQALLRRLEKWPELRPPAE